MGMNSMLHGTALACWTLVAACTWAHDGSQKNPEDDPHGVFQRFGSKVGTRRDGRYLWVESDGMPTHRMMVGITAWQQQVPLPQPYRGANAWPIPLQPTPAKTPMSAKDNFFRGAIAVAANGIPIFKIGRAHV